jgi:hypothetical protein
MSALIDTQTRKLRAQLLPRGGSIESVDLIEMKAGASQELVNPAPQRGRADLFPTIKSKPFDLHSGIQSPLVSLDRPAVSLGVDLLFPGDCAGGGLSDDGQQEAPERHPGRAGRPGRDEAGRKASPAASPRSRRRHREVRVMWFQIGVLVVVTTIFAAEVRWILKA